MHIVMPGHSCSKDGVASLAYVPGILVFLAVSRLKTWMAGTSPAMTTMYDAEVKCEAAVAVGGSIPGSLRK